MMNAKPPNRQGKTGRRFLGRGFGRMTRIGKDLLIYPCHPRPSAAKTLSPLLPWRLGGLAFILLFVSTIHAHPARLAAGTASVDRAGNVEIDLTIDLPAFMLNDLPQRISDKDMNALLDGPRQDLAAALADAKDRLLHSSKLKNGEFESVTFPSVDEVENITGLTRLPMMMDVSLRGHLAPDAGAFSVDFPESLGSIILTVERPDADPRAFAIDGGDFSPPVPVVLAQAPPATPIAEPARLSVALRYVILGIEHIVPRGPDHILFILGLFLLSTRLSSLFWQISAFTIAHSITLGLAMYGIVRLPPAIVEPLIAASIAFIAVENLLTTKLHPWRPAVVFLFGLVHGMGFASVLIGLGLPRRDFATTLVSFNAGVELGQLAVVGCALLAVGWFRRCAWYRSAVVVPLSVMIAISGIAWTVQRLM
jgi:HupE/UreJ protein